MTKIKALLDGTVAEYPFWQQSLYDNNIFNNKKAGVSASWFYPLYEKQEIEKEIEI
ncbi:MAG: hypothetical protein Q8P86_01370 [bacterium]|nr:hypothetical protein [bacterium]